MIGKKDLSPQLFYHISLADLVPQGSFYRVLKHSFDWSFIRELVLDQELYGCCGQASIDPEVFFKLELVGYLENLDSTRKVIELASQHLGIRYLINYDLQESLPWHSTISRTRQRMPVRVYRQIFDHILEKCIHVGLVDGSKQSIDSSLIKANASLNSLSRKSPVLAVEDHLDRLDQFPLREAQLGEQDQENDSDSNQSPPKLEVSTPSAPNPAKKKVRKKRSNRTRQSSTDPDARMARKPSSPAGMYYMSQIGVDSLSHVITYVEADYADHVDCDALPGIISRIRFWFEARKLQLRSIVADANYSSGANYKYLELQGIDGYIPSSGGYLPEREGFSFDKAQDCYHCPKGKKLIFRGMAGRKKDQRIYATSKRECSGCELASNCLNYQRKERRRILRQQDYDAYERAMERLKTKEGESMLTLRKSTVEPTFGTLKTRGGLRRIRSRGIEGANKEMLMAAAMYNLKKYLKKIPRPKAHQSVLAKSKIKKGVISYIELLISFELKSIFVNLSLNPDKRWQI